MVAIVTPSDVMTSLGCSNREAWRKMREAGAVQIYRYGRMVLVLAEESWKR
jgi:hypothetical protein